MAGTAGASASNRCRTHPPRRAAPWPAIPGALAMLVDPPRAVGVERRPGPAVTPSGSAETSVRAGSPAGDKSGASPVRTAQANRGAGVGIFKRVMDWSPMGLHGPDNARGEWPLVTTAWNIKPLQPLRAAQEASLVTATAAPTQPNNGPAAIRKTLWRLAATETASRCRRGRAVIDGVDRLDSSPAGAWAAPSALKTRLGSTSRSSKVRGVAPSPAIAKPVIAGAFRRPDARMRAKHDRETPRRATLRRGLDCAGSARARPWAGAATPSWSPSCSRLRHPTRRAAPSIRKGRAPTSSA